MTFDQYDAKRAKDAIPPLDASAAINRAFYAGDLWQGGAQWIGPWPAIGEPGASEVHAAIAKAFVGANTLLEIVDRHMRAVVGREPAWSLTVTRDLADEEQPTPDEQARIDEAEAMLTTWWDTRKAHRLLQQATALALVANRATLRLYVPSGLRSEATGEVVITDWQKATDCLYLDPLPDPASAGVITDPATRRTAGVFVAQFESKEQIELCYLNVENGMTVLRTLGQDGQPYERDWGGELPLHDITLDPLITETQRSLQRLRNLALTMLGRNVVTAGFVSRMILNAQMPTYEDADGNIQVLAIKAGPATAQALEGKAIYGDTDNPDIITGYATPSIHESQPVAVTTFDDTERKAYAAALAEAGQSYALISGDATASGESRIQARHEFVLSLGETTAAVEAATRWLLETAAAMLSDLNSAPGRYRDLRAVATCRVDAGPLSADEMRVIAEMKQAGLFDLQLALERLGVDDVDAVIARLNAEQDTASQRDTASLGNAFGRSSLIVDQITNGQQTQQSQQQGGTGQNG